MLAEWFLLFQRAVSDFVASVMDSRRNEGLRSDEEDEEEKGKQKEGEEQDLRKWKCRGAELRQEVQIGPVLLFRFGN